MENSFLDENVEGPDFWGYEFRLHKAVFWRWGISLSLWKGFFWQSLCSFHIWKDPSHLCEFQVLLVKDEETKTWGAAVPQDTHGLCLFGSIFSFYNVHIAGIRSPGVHLVLILYLIIDILFEIWCTWSMPQGDKKCDKIGLALGTKAEIEHL